MEHFIVALEKSFDTMYIEYFGHIDLPQLTLTSGGSRGGSMGSIFGRTICNRLFIFLF